MKTKLTKSIVETTFPDLGSKGAKAKDIIIWDTELSGFYLKITPKGKRVMVSTIAIGMVKSVARHLVPIARFSPPRTLVRKHVSGSELLRMVEIPVRKKKSEKPV